MRSRTWCFTLNNPSHDDFVSITSLRVRNLIANLEWGENGTPHYQGYLELEHQTTLSSLKTKLPRAHLEPRRGSKEQAVKYCLKDVSPDVIDSLSPNQGWQSSLGASETDPPSFVLYQEGPYTLMKTAPTMKRKEILNEMKKMIDEGKSDKDLAEYDFAVYISSYRGLSHYRVITSTPRDHEVTVTVIQGPTGTGKSRHCKEQYPGAYWKQRSNWWDGYEGQETVIIDEFYGWLPFDLLLRICDRYPLLVETKGGQVNFTAKNIIITSNTVPERWYKNVYFKSFARRVSKWIIMPVWGSSLEFQNYADAHSHMYIEDINI